MSDTPLDRIIKKTGEALTPLPIPEQKRKEVKRAASPKYDLSEKAFAKQIDEILKGEK